MFLILSASFERMGRRRGWLYFYQDKVSRTFGVYLTPVTELSRIRKQPQDLELLECLVSISCEGAECKIRHPS